MHTRASRMLEAEGPQILNIKPGERGTFPKGPWVWPWAPGVHWSQMYRKPSKCRKPRVAEMGVRLPRGDFSRQETG